MRPADLIQTTKAKRRTRGRGSHRRWLPAAMLRACFGSGEVKKKPKKKRTVSTISSSTHALSQQYQCSDTHLQKVRNTVAQACVDGQAEGIASVCDECESLDYGILELRWDETQTPVSVPEAPLAPGLPSDDTVAGYFPVVMIKGSLIYKKKGCDVLVEPLILGPMVLRESCSADELWRAIKTRLPPEVRRLLSQCDHVGILMGHDSHRANLRYVDASLATKEPDDTMLSSRCSMHQAQICLKDVYTLPSLSFHNELFCGCKILMRGHQLSSLKSRMNGLVRKVKVIYRKPSPANQAHARLVMELLFSTRPCS